MSFSLLLVAETVVMRTERLSQITGLQNQNKEMKDAKAVKKSAAHTTHRLRTTPRFNVEDGGVCGGVEG